MDFIKTEIENSVKFEVSSKKRKGVDQLRGPIVCLTSPVPLSLFSLVFIVSNHVTRSSKLQV